MWWDTLYFKLQFRRIKYLKFKKRRGLQKRLRIGKVFGSFKGEGSKYLREEKLHQRIEWPPPPTLERSAYHAYLRLWSGLRGWDDNPEVWTRRRRPSSFRRYLRVWRTRGRISVPGDLKHGGAWSRGALEHRVSAFISATVNWYTDRHTKPWRLPSAALILNILTIFSSIIYFRQV